jgi:hypothetical protein
MVLERTLQKLLHLHRGCSPATRFNPQNNPIGHVEDEKSRQQNLEDLSQQPLHRDSHPI